MNRKAVNNISDEILAAYLDGNATSRECQEILSEIGRNDELRELLYISQEVDKELCMTHNHVEYIPMTAIAATCEENNYCSMECEKHILSRHDIEFKEEELLKNAMEQGWMSESGTALHNIGRHLESKGLYVVRKYNCCIEDIVNALDAEEGVMAVVDEKKLLENLKEEISKDLPKSETPNHSVVILSCDIEKHTVTIFDPNSQNSEDTYPLSQFIEAWNDSKNYLVTAAPVGKKRYIPCPIDISDVELGDELDELREAIAENAHEIWAEERQAEGWTYGPERNDTLKQTPDMVPYSQLPDKEKDYDRKMAMKTIKLLKKLGYDIVKRNDAKR